MINGGGQNELTILTRIHTAVNGQRSETNNDIYIYIYIFLRQSTRATDSVG